jgi:hypothetical protein
VYCRLRHAFSYRVLQVLKQVHPKLSVDMPALAVLNDIVVYLMDQLMGLAENASHHLQDADIYRLHITSAVGRVHLGADSWLCAKPDSGYYTDPWFVLNSAIACNSLDVPLSSGGPGAVNKLVDSSGIELAVSEILVGEMIKHTHFAAYKALTKWTTKKQERVHSSMNAIAGLQFSPGK